MGRFVTRRILVHLSVATVAGLAGLPAVLAQSPSFPTKPITLIVPFTAGGATDVQARALATAASRELGQQIIVMNRPGVGGTFGPSTMAQSAAPDGYTVSIVPASLFRLPHLQKVSYDPIADFTYIIGVTSYTYGITVAANAPWKTLAEFLAHAKANPGKVSYGATGKGTTGHIIMERLAKAAGVQLNFVPFKGAADEYLALAGNHIDMVSDAGFGAVVEGGKARLLGTFTEERLKKQPNVPTLKELGHDIVARSPWGIAGPKGMDPKIAQALHDAFRKAMADPQFSRTLEVQDMPQAYLSSKDYTKFAADQFAEDKRFVAELDIKLE